MEICIFQTGEPLHIDKGNYRPMRCMLLTDKLINRGHKVTIISSGFFHQRKIHRSKFFKTIKFNKNLTIHLIPSIGYKKHISLLRILDHLILSINLFLFLKNKKNFKPDRIFLGYPPIFTAYVIIKWSIFKKIPLLLDLKDKWPETFIEPFPRILKPIARIIFSPYFFLSKYSIKNSIKITTISDGFLSWIMNYVDDKNKEKYFVTPLTRKPVNLSKNSRLQIQKYWENKNIRIFEDNYFCFVGSYSISFDFNFIYDLSNELIHKYPKIKIILCGSGDKYKYLIRKFSTQKNVFIFGEIDKYNSKVLIENALATLAPYKNNVNFYDHIPNKIIESLENGTPFITTLEGTLKKLILDNSNGIFISSLNKLNFEPILKLVEDKKFQNELKKNSRKSYKKLFDFDVVYDNLIDKLIEI